MDHGEVPFNLSTDPPFMTIPTNYPYDATYASWPESTPGADPLHWLYQSRREPNWMAAPASSFISQSPEPTLRYRKIRPRLPHASTPIPPATCPRKSKEEKKLGREKHSKHSRESGQKSVQNPTNKTRRTLSGVTDPSNPLARDVEMRFA